MNQMEIAPWDRLPDHLKQECIMNLLSLSELALVAGTCKFFRDLYRQRLERDGPEFLEQKAVSALGQEFVDLIVKLLSDARPAP
jgi:hypothetical protein